MAPDPAPGRPASSAVRRLHAPHCGLSSRRCCCARTPGAPRSEAADRDARGVRRRATSSPDGRRRRTPSRVRRRVTYWVTTRGRVDRVDGACSGARPRRRTTTRAAGAPAACSSAACGAAATSPSCWPRPRRCRPSPPTCSTQWSCRIGRFVVINQERWRHASPAWNAAGRSLRDYRHMVVNHETGHWLGRGHASCPGRGRPAPVMMQQSKGTGGCRFNPWPLGWEAARSERASAGSVRRGEPQVHAAASNSLPVDRRQVEQVEGEVGDHAVAHRRARHAVDRAAGARVVVGRG